MTYFNFERFSPFWCTKFMSRKKTIESHRAVKPASQLIDRHISDLGDWRGETLSRMRALIIAADPEMTEDWKWDIPVWKHDGLICTGEVYKNHVKFTFARGALLADPAGLFNSGLEGHTRRAIDVHEGGLVDADGFKTLVRRAVDRNISDRSKKPRKQKI
jgi:hypothetical protein